VNGKWHALCADDSTALGLSIGDVIWIPARLDVDGENYCILAHGETADQLFGFPEGDRVNARVKTVSWVRRQLDYGADGAIETHTGRAALLIMQLLSTSAFERQYGGSGEEAGRS
jgi:hypothetical protein